MGTMSNSGLPPPSILDGKVPVFVFPVQLDFYYEDQTTHKRVVTIYNPYEFDVTFKVLCNNPKKYAVVEPEGRILGQKCVDIVIRHVAVSPQSCETTDKFRIHMYEEGTNEPRSTLGLRRLRVPPWGRRRGKLWVCSHPWAPTHSLNLQMDLRVTEIINLRTTWPVSLP